MKFELKLMEKDSTKSPWWEEYFIKEIKNIKEALAYGLELVEDFNTSLRKGERPRVVLSAKMGHTNSDKARRAK